MNDVPFHTPFDVLNLCTAICLSFPLLAALVRPVTRKIHFLPVTLVFLLFLGTALVNNGWLAAPESFRTLLTALSFLLLSPLVLGFLPFFLDNSNTGKEFLRATRLSLPAYLLIAVVIVVRQGLTETTGSLVSGLGYLLVMLFSVPIFVRQVGYAVRKRHENGKAFMISSIVFSFACYILFFLLHLVPSAGVQQADLLLLFQLATILFAVLMSVGIILYKPAVIEIPVQKADKLPMLTEWEEFTRK
jgi:hypothetical protein